MSKAPPNLDQRRRAIRLWLLTVAALMLVTLVGLGATRLTESGLSSVEWRPLTAILPPLDGAGLRAELDTYETPPKARGRACGRSAAQPQRSCGTKGRC